MTNDSHGHGNPYAWGPPDICSPALILPILDERTWDRNTRAVLYLVGMLYCFLGVAIVTDIFMSAIEVITSTTKKLYLSKQSDKSNKKVSSYLMKVWSNLG